MWGKKKDELLKQGLDHFENGRYDDAIQYFRKQLDEDPSSAEALYHLKQAKAKSAPTYSWTCKDCKTQQESSIFPETAGSAEMKRGMEAEMWAEIADSVRDETCKSCGREASSSIYLCENCFEDYIAFVTFTDKGRGATSLSTTFPSCPKCGHRQKLAEDKPKHLVKRYRAMLEKYPATKAFAEVIRKSGVLK